MGPELVALDVIPWLTHVYGIPEHADLMNLDTVAPATVPSLQCRHLQYELDSRLPMYGSIPLMLVL